jgi:hypothetical protein
VSEENKENLPAGGAGSEPEYYEEILYEDPESAEPEYYGETRLEDPEKPKEEAEPFLETGSTIFAEKSGIPKKKPKKHKEKKAFLAPLLSGVLVVALLIGGFFTARYFFPEPAESEATESETITALSEDLNAVETFIVQNAGGTLHFSRKPPETNASADSSESAPEFQVDELSGIPQGSYTISSVASAAVKMTATAKFTPEDFTPYGLEDPYAAVTVTRTDGSSYNLKIGRESPTGEGRYVRQDESDTVYLVETYTVETFGGKLTDYVDTAITQAVTAEGDDDEHFTSDTLTSYDKLVFSGSRFLKPVTFSYNQSDIYPNRTSGVYKNVAVDYNKMTTLLQALAAGFTATEVYTVRPTAADLKTYGLDNPYTVLEYEIGSTKVLLKFGNGPDKDSYAVMLQGVDVVYKYTKPSPDFPAYTEQDFYSRSPFMANIVDVKTLTITSEGTSQVFKVTNAAENSDDSSTLSTTAVSLDGQALDVDNFKRLYQCVIGMTAKEMGLDYKISGAPEMTITFEYSNGSRTPDVLTLYHYSDLRSLLVVNGQGYALADYKTAAKLLEKTVDLVAGKEVKTDDMP